MSRFTECSDFDKERFFQKYPKYRGHTLDEAFYTTHLDNPNWTQIRFDILGGGGSYIWREFACPFCLHLPTITRNTVDKSDKSSPFWFYCDLCDVKVTPDVAKGLCHCSPFNSDNDETKVGCVTFDLASRECVNTSGMDNFTVTALQAMKMK